jgi:lipopolysaccharide transport system ATP-binding protein
MRFLNRFRMRGTLLFVSHDSGAVAKLCDRALWLERGQVRGFGSAKEVCRLYLAAQAEEKAEDQARFQIGGRSRSVPAVQISEREVQTAPSDPIDNAAQLVFDADDPPRADGGAEIEATGFFGSGGEKLQVAQGGETVEIRIACRARRTVANAVFAYILRDRLGQIIFSDDTASCAPQSLAAEESATARFRFLLPYLASGTYAIEAFLFERKGEELTLLQHRAAKEFLYVQSPHPSDGLANIGMRGVSLRRVSPVESGPDAAARMAGVHA